MAGSTDPDAASSDGSAFTGGMDRTFAEALGRNARAQAEFFEAWQDVIESSIGVDGAGDAFAGYVRAYETWMEATRLMFERVGDSMGGEEVPIEEFRDIWLDAANDAFKDVMGTEAFAAATGQTVEEVLDFNRQAEEITSETWHAMGLASRRDVMEVGDRLVELERRQHRVEEKLDRILKQLEE